MDGVQQADSETAAMTNEPLERDSSRAAPVTSSVGPFAGPSDAEQPESSPVNDPATSAGGGGGGEPDRPAAAAASSHVQEISQQNIKNRLNEVITEIEREVEQELDREDREQLTGEEHRQERVQETARTGAQETATPTASDQSASFAGGQGETNDQWQELTGSSQSVSSGIVSEQNSDHSTLVAIINKASPENDLQMANEVERVTSRAASSTMQHPGTASSEVQTEPIAYQAREGRFASPFSSTATSSLPRGWPGSGGGVAFAVSGHPAPPPAAHEAPEHQQRARPRPHDQWKAREAAASPYATLPRMPNAEARGWENHPKRVHFADAPEVQTFDDDAAETQVTMRDQPEAPRGPRPVSAPAAAQMFTIPNMAARPYGRTSPLLVMPARRASPPPVLGRGDAEVDACMRDEQRETQEMSSQLPEPEPEPEPEPVIPPAPPVQQTPAPPSKIFTPAHDEPAMPQKKKTMFVDSAFFSPKVHPTWEQQVEMAKRISSSLSDASNLQSKGQSMYERRKKRSVKWVHGGSQSDMEDGCESPQVPKDKPLLQLVMNPHGHVYDLNALKKQGWIIDNKGGLSPEICSDLIKDLNSPNGKGAQIFAKRKKRAEKWVVDEEHREARKAEQSQVDSAPQMPPAAPQLSTPAPQPAAAVPQPPLPTPAVQRAPVPLQTLYQPPPPPQFPSGGVYAPRTAPGWPAAQETETKKFKSTSSKAFAEITQGHSMKNTAQKSFSESRHVNASSHQSIITAVGQGKITQQSRLTRAMQHEENKENISSSQVLQAMDTSDMSQQDVELRMAEAVFEETARQMEIAGSSGQTRLSLDPLDLPAAELTSGHTSDPADPMEIDPDVSPQLAMLKPIDKPADWAGGATDLVKPSTKPASEPAVVLPALKPISKPVDWAGPQDAGKPSDRETSEEPRPLVSLKPVTLSAAEKEDSKAPEEPRPLVSLKPVVKPTDHPVDKPGTEEPKPLVCLKPVPKTPLEKSVADEAVTSFGALLTPARPAGGQRQSQLVHQHQEVTSEVTEEVSGVWGRVSAIRDTFDAGLRSSGGSRPPLLIEKPRAPTMAVPNAFHQMPSAHGDSKTAPAAPNFGRSSEGHHCVDNVNSAVQQNQKTENQLEAWGDEDEQAYLEPAEFISCQSDNFTEDFGQVMSDDCHQSYKATENVFQSQSAFVSSEFRQSATGGSTSDRPQRPINAPGAAEARISGLEGTDDVMGTDDVIFQCEVAMVETTVNQEALQDHLGRAAAQDWLKTSVVEPRPSSAPPTPEISLRSPPAPVSAFDQTDTSQAVARAAMLAERQLNRQSWTNYNTAPRGWGNQDHFYRPVTFTQPLLSQ